MAKSRMIGHERVQFGGFFALEIPQGRGALHPRARAFHTGRACLAALLAHKRPKLVHLPFFICHVIVDVVRALGIDYRFYAIDETFTPVDLPSPSPNELLLLVNYFGLQAPVLAPLVHEFGDRLIIDNTQGFFEIGDTRCWSFVSARKFFGVPDGAYLYTPESMPLDVGPPFKPRVTHLVNSLYGLRRTAFRQFRKGESQLTADLLQMSELSMRLLASYDYNRVAETRRSNYHVLHNALKGINLLQVSMPPTAVPYCYPLVIDHHISRAALASQSIYVPTLWQEVIDSKTEAFELERRLAACLLPLPIDQRYAEVDMLELLERLESFGLTPIEES